MESKTLFLGDEAFKFLTSKTGWTEAYYRKIDSRNTDDIPVYTAAKGPVAHVRQQNIVPIYASTLEPIISFGANGDASAGTNFVYHERPFYVSNDRTCLKVINPNISPRYTYYKLQNIKRIYGFDFNYKATQKNASLISLEVPINDDGEFSINKQEDFVKLFEKQLGYKNALIDIKDRILNANVVVDSEYTFDEVFLDNKQLFTLTIGRRVKQEEVLKNGIPVISSNVKEVFGYLDYTIIDDFSKPSILWGIDGNFEYNFYPAGVEFMPTDHCGVIRVEHLQIDPYYVYYYLQTTKDRYGFDRTFRSSLTNMKNVSILIPTRNGLFDLEAQALLAKRYNRIEQTKQAVIESLGYLTSIVVSL